MKGGRVSVEFSNNCTRELPPIILFSMYTYGRTTRTEEERAGSEPQNNTFTDILVDMFVCI